ncbi:hypothetical protein P691DRAFT_806209 [Macrolepiota fuliginosa MF-IS2]|uniref:NACHT domain-containing protein n=1 Tax=Macrolepiota fuliginosa MF-IS2 TaxID=1400762 RepID=A0A9P5X5U0_9AGAR|nr:hypothetical protein P691DRAFT_806209 [Macrolepiota fuliginosa MF-IS2]
MKRNKRKQSEVTDNPNENSPDMWGRKKRRKGIIEYGSGDSGSRSPSTQVTDNSNFPHELLTGATKKPSTARHPASVFPAGPSGVVTSNPTPHTEYFSGAHHFTIYKPTMIEGDSTNERQSMKLLAKHTIVGAEFDSSDHRPSCYPETRLDISRSIQSWMRNPARKHKILWLHGPAGVGKSAILQTVAETEADSPTPILGATLFFSRPNSRDDPQCVFITIAYRLAVIYPPYRHYIVKLFALDPRLIEKSMREQFKAFIVRPFAEEKLMDGLHDTVLILLDGLDECKGEEAQREIISLVGRFSLQYPTSPLIWLFASRPEPHIRGAFASEGVQLSYEEIQVFVDSDQARRDVETYLRASFAKIQKRYPQSISSSLQQWPSELDFSTIATRSSGLFIFPSTIVRFIGDTAYADPESRLKTVLEVIESTSSSGGGCNPFETLDALYTRILSEIPRDVLSTTLGLLAMYAARFDLGNFALNCNWLGITQGRAYGALQRLHSVLEIPEPQNALTEDIQASHASFYDYLLSPSRSGAFYVIAPEIVQHLLLRWIRILLESHSIETSDVDVTRIKLSWPIANKEDRLHIQRRSFGWSLDLLMSVLDEFVNDSVRNEFSRLAVFFRDLDFGEVVDYVGMFNMLVYPESVFAMNLKHWGVLRTIPLQSFNFNDIRFDLDPKIGRYKERGVSLRVAWGTAGQGDTVPVWERILRYARIVNNQGEVPADFWGTNLSDRPTWKADLQKNLATWTDKAPSHPITMLGRGRKSCACFQFHVPGELWVLTLPCVQSS